MNQLQSAISWASGWGLWNWSGWQWAGWAAISAVGTVLAAAAATFALIYFRRQASLMAKQLKVQRVDQASAQLARLEEAQAAVTPLISLVGGAVTIAPGLPPAYDVCVSANADGAGFAHNLILNLHAATTNLLLDTRVVPYIRAPATQAIVLRCAVAGLPLVGVPIPTIGAVEVKGLFFNPWGQQIEFVHSGRIDLNTNLLTFTAPPHYSWPWKSLTEAVPT